MNGSYDFMRAKFDENGNVREGWNYREYLEWYWEHAPRIGTAECNTFSHPSRNARRAERQARSERLASGRGTRPRDKAPAR